MDAAAFSRHPDVQLQIARRLLCCRRTIVCALCRKRNVYRPYREQLLQVQSPNIDSVLSDVILCENKYTTDLVFFKHMGKQLLPGTD